MVMDGYMALRMVMGCHWVVTCGSGWSRVGIQEVVMGGCGVVTGCYGWYWVVTGVYHLTGYGWLGMGPSRPTP